MTVSDGSRGMQNVGPGACKMKEIGICDKELILHHLINVYKDSNCIYYSSN